jgi:phosphoglycerol geranylgeranyltransferase
MNVKKTPWRNWKHITKLDPDKNISQDDLKTIVESGTDAIMISGTQNITGKSVSKLISLLKRYKIPKILEPATPDAVMYEGVDYIFVPLVLNSTDLMWIIGKHVEWILNHTIRWSEVVPEAYIVLNPDSAVGKLTMSNTALNTDEVIAYAQYAEMYLRIPIIYIEYSGTYGDPSVVKRLSEVLAKASLFYGGGIDTKERAIEMKSYADVIIVGNVIYTNMDRFLETVP